MHISVFDIFKIGIGPSSSHTVGPMRAARRFAEWLEAEALIPNVEAIKVDEYEGDDRTGARIVVRALEEPIRQLADNAGLEGSIVVDKIRNAPKGNGLNVETGEYEDLIKAGITDPTMVVRSALQNAASIAKNILTTEAIVAEVPEKDAGGAGGGMPDMGGMGGMM